MSQKTYKDIFTGHIDVSLKTAVNILAGYPESAAAFARIGKWLKKSEAVRKRHVAEGIEVPQLLIVSTTKNCNLACAGCYDRAHVRAKNEEIEDGRITEILDEASGLGVSVVMLAGGEPLLSRGWLEAMSGHREMAGLVFTNGTLFDAARRAWFSERRHMIPVFSVEGGEAQTDSRRGTGVYARVTQAMDGLRADGIPFGVSITVTGENIDNVLDENLITDYIQKGCRLFIFVEYVPVTPGSEPLVLSSGGKKRLSRFASDCAKRFPALFIPFPGDEDEFGGCLAAGRGFIHISPDGNVEPCPFAPFSDTNLKHLSLKEALSSEFLAKIRENHHLLKEGGGGCALWHNREWLASLSEVWHEGIPE